MNYMFLFNYVRRSEFSCHGTGNDISLSAEDEMDEDPVVIDSHGGKKKRPLPPRVSWKINAGVARDLNALVEIQLTKVGTLILATKTFPCLIAGYPYMLNATSTRLFEILFVMLV